MNKQRILELANIIERNANTSGQMAFDMCVFFQVTQRNNECGTAGCIAGWCVTYQVSRSQGVAPPTDDKKFYRLCTIDPTYEAAAYLHLTLEQMSSLFAPHHKSKVTGNRFVHSTDPRLAVRVLRNLVRDGEVNWQKAEYELIAEDENPTPKGIEGSETIIEELLREAEPEPAAVHVTAAANQ